MKIRRFNENANNVIDDFRSITTHFSDSLKDFSTEVGFDLYWFDSEFEGLCKVKDNKAIIKDDLTEYKIEYIKKISNDVFYMGAIISFTIDLVEADYDDGIELSSFISKAEDAGSIAETIKSLDSHFQNSDYRKNMFISKNDGIKYFIIELVDLKNKYYLPK